MIKSIVLPGSEGEEAATGAVGSSGRFSDDDLGALAEVIRWWRHRLARGDSADPLESHYGGVDADGTARTAGLVPTTAAFGRPLLPAGGATAGAALLVLALGVPDPPAAGEVYSLAGLCHFHYTAAAGWLSRHTTLGRAPAGATSTEVRAAIDLGTNQPILQLVGVGGLTIDWKVEVYRLEFE
jgi:hypothetical protein